MGKPGWGHAQSPMAESIGHAEVSQRTETSQYREEKTSTEIPQVVASERGGAQTDCCAIPAMGCSSGVDSRTGREVTLRGGRDKTQADSKAPGTDRQRR